ncbi:hypothetical protein DUI87_26336 [Hirundo rustica rustica]|uniref:Uncharacterized protein n=1 Tax=Hirundo rustica rustica TaxID=333673 RepID=A0A3M0J8B7_HIRRU|nr:hypothetical protein DUI87_26336 [Hirundo rustica rustica]
MPTVPLLIFPGLAMAPSVQTRGLTWALLLSQNLKYCGPERRILGAGTWLSKILREEWLWLDPSPAADLSKPEIVLERSQEEEKEKEGEDEEEEEEEEEDKKDDEEEEDEEEKEGGRRKGGV